MIRSCIIICFTVEKVLIAPQCGKYILNLAVRTGSNRYFLLPGPDRNETESREPETNRYKFRLGTVVEGASFARWYKVMRKRFIKKLSVLNTCDLTLSCLHTQCGANAALSLHYLSTEIDVWTVLCRPYFLSHYVTSLLKPPHKVSAIDLCKNCLWRPSLSAGLGNSFWACAVDLLCGTSDRRCACVHSAETEHFSPGW